MAMIVVRADVVLYLFCKHNKHSIYQLSQTISPSADRQQHKTKKANLDRNVSNKRDNSHRKDFFMKGDKAETELRPRKDEAAATRRQQQLHEEKMINRATGKHPQKLRHQAATAGGKELKRDKSRARSLSPSFLGILGFTSKNEIDTDQATKTRERKPRSNSPKDRRRTKNPPPAAGSDGPSKKGPNDESTPSFSPSFSQFWAVPRPAPAHPPHPSNSHHRKKDGDKRKQTQNARSKSPVPSGRGQSREHTKAGKNDTK